MTLKLFSVVVGSVILSCYDHQNFYPLKLVLVVPGKIGVIQVVSDVGNRMGKRYQGGYQGRGIGS
jgi:hypothetical protein